MMRSEAPFVPVLALVLFVGCGDGIAPTGTGGGGSGGDASSGSPSSSAGPSGSGGTTISASAGSTSSTTISASAGSTSSTTISASAGSTSSTATSASAGSTSSTATSASAGSTSSAATSASAGSTSSTGAGGAATCDVSAPPDDVAAWIKESWGDQLGNNVKTREAWLLDSVMKGKGEINLCVRWGATSAVTQSVADNVATTTERWFNNWFTALGSYGCFPYPNGVKVKVTGYAVKPGQQGLLKAVDPSIPVYTQTDGDGEPKCPDACSFFVHWDHKFPSCPGGEANHTDYWLWFDDTLPGGGGAAAVGGDWGLRMPVSTFTSQLNNASFGIVEHEMGHGFGFQDYYTWAGSTPKGGSLMIVGSTGSQKPTIGDQWLLRRTWTEMKSIRGW